MQDWLKVVQAGVGQEAAPGDVAELMMTSRLPVPSWNANDSSKKITLNEVMTLVVLGGQNCTLLIRSIDLCHHDLDLMRSVQFKKKNELH